MNRRCRPALAGALQVALTLTILCGVEWLLDPTCSYAVQKSEAALQLEFGVKVARKGSWLEAAFRFEKAIKAGGGTARAWNNLAVAKESLGRFEEAREAYEKALALEADGDDERRIRDNYDRLRSFLDASRKPTDSP